VQLQRQNGCAKGRRAETFRSLTVVYQYILERYTLVKGEPLLVSSVVHKFE
jgi:hypothetical protein